MTGGSFFQRVAARLIFSLLLLSLLFYLFFRRLRLWLNGIHNGPNAYFNRIFSLSERPLQRIVNNCLITNFVPSKGTISGCPFTVESSCLSEGTCYVLTDVPTRSLHQALIGDRKKLQDFLSTGAIRCFPLQYGSGSFTVDLTDNFQQTQGKCPQRGRYSSVIAMVSNAKPEDEQVVISCYVIHVRLSEEERFDTSILYTFWKTNWDRLLTPQLLYAARNDSADQSSAHLAPPTVTSENHEPHCFICLSSSISEGLRVLLPCRHAGLCNECFQTYCQKTAWSRDAILHGILCCPLCRSPVYSVLRLPPVSSE
ncbi:hypothetical protein T265_03240 [Opisthorchis viverrini]|uniref:RING-type domain-containing protein n=1 Tax=Opisthorchis viverrini TaxID=6198 RepID=A0A074ZT55_OPIVI|nr:hypothetical protein T265_03240 [Opisthorchis viverrini]KER30291.1 hypothetical protein T265_03240 [Opisthorchis viverrini]